VGEDEHGGPGWRRDDLVGLVGVEAVEANQGVEVDHAAALVLPDLAEGKPDPAGVAMPLSVLGQETDGADAHGAPPQLPGLVFQTT
jgi:hypothetical protein